MKSHILKLVLLATVVTTSGCSSFGLGEPEFSCKGLPEGVTCMSAREVYKETNDRDHLEFYSEDKDVEKNDRKSAELASNAQPTAQSVYIQQPVLANYNADDPVPVTGAPAPLAIRTPGKVIRIWLAPWEDDQGDVNLAGYVYSEIETRRWKIGEQSVKDTARIVPLQVTRPKSEQSQKVSPNKFDFLRTPGQGVAK